MFADYLKNILAGFMLGLSSGVFCAGACAPVFVPYLLSEYNKLTKETLRIIVEFNAGRLLAYIIWGALAAGLGVKLKEGFAAWSLIITSVLLIIFGLTKNFPSIDLCKNASRLKAFRKIHILFGFLIGINICPPFLVAFSFVMDLKSAVRGMVFFLAFFCGTLVWYTPLLFSKLLSKSENLRMASQVACLISGVWFLILGLTRLFV